VKVSALLRLLRIHNAFMGSLTVIISMLLWTQNLLLISTAILAYVFLASAGNVINDIYDLEVDKINRPDRPIPSGRISLNEAKIIYVLLVILGLIFCAIDSYLVNNIWPFIMGIIFAYVGFLYSAKLKIMGFIGNVTVGISFSIGFIYGWTVCGLPIDWNRLVSNILFFTVASTLLIAREIIKGIEDVKGDALRNVRTLARTRGIKTASIVASLFLFLAIGSFTALPFLGIVSVYFIPFMVIGNLAAFLSAIYILKDPSYASKASCYAKIGALFGLFGFLLGVVL